MLKLSNVTERPDLLEVAHRHIEQAINYLKFNSDLIVFKERLKIYSAPLGRCAGKAYLGENIIVLDDYILENNRDNMINDTLPHEVAHLVADILYGRDIAPHGKEWRNCCEIIGHPQGRNADTFHAENHKPLRNTRKFKYICGGCNSDIQVGLNIHRKIFSNNQRICVKCRSIISKANFISEV